MYSVVTWEIDPGTPDPGTIESEAVVALGERRTCRLGGGSRIVRVASGTDFVMVAEALQRVADTHPGLFTYALWALSGGSAMRTNLLHDEECAREVTRV